MRIGFDAKWYFDGPPSGKMVVKNLVEHLIALDQNNSYVFFLNKSDRNKHFPFSGKNISVEYIWGKNNLISNTLVLPFHANKLNVDYVIFQNFSSIWGKYKKVSYIHDILFLTYPQYYTKIERLYFSPLCFLARKSDLVFTISESEKKRLLEKGIENSITIYNGISKIFKPRDKLSPESLKLTKEKYGLPDEYLLYVGRLNIRKNIFNLLHSLKYLKNDIPLVIVGAQDWKMFNLEETIKSLGVENKVLFTGAVSEEDLIRIYSLSKVFCFPSFAEGFGLPALEAMASGVPVVVSNTTSLPEICGDAGNYIEPTDPKNIAAMIDRLLDDEAIYKTKVKSGLERAKQFNWNIAAQKIINALENNK